jgi:hydroxypyruvate isomerase
MIYSPSLEILFNKSSLSFVERIHKVHDLGFKSFEFWGWPEKDLAEIRQISQELGIKVASMCANNTSLADPSRREEFLLGLKDSLEAAKHKLQKET